MKEDHGEERKIKRKEGEIKEKQVNKV